MKQYKVIVNGTEYEVFAELISDDGKAAPAPAQAPAAPAAAPAPAQAPAPAASGEGEVVKAPLTGTILAVNINAGDTVKKGDVVMVLEAMKMENEIMAPRDGKVTAVAASKGAAVEAGAALYTLA
ncbi:MAG: biotin/lipoyl-binding protein [Clostridia bacterium]|nr:biotin/lipoyl-binding protein [Clostridia bacterium]